MRWGAIRGGFRCLPREVSVDERLVAPTWLNLPPGMPSLWGLCIQNIRGAVGTSGDTFLYLPSGAMTQRLYAQDTLFICVAFYQHTSLSKTLWQVQATCYIKEFEYYGYTYYFPRSYVSPALASPQPGPSRNVTGLHCIYLCNRWWKIVETNENTEPGGWCETCSATKVTWEPESPVPGTFHEQWNVSPITGL